MKITTEIETITPSKAKEYLKKSNPNNRTIMETVVATYARDMQKGNWKANGETIVFDKNGMLQNGHHRLNAVIKSGCNIVFNVCRGVEPECVITYDDFSARKKSQVLQMEGLLNANPVSSATRLALIYKNRTGLNGEIKSWNTTYKPTTTEMRDECFENYELYQWAFKNASIIKTHSKGMFSLPSLIVVYVIACDNWKNKERVEVFAEKIAKGNSLELTDPELILRNMANRHREDKRKHIHANYMRNAIIYAWNASLKGKKITSIRLRDANRILEILV